MAQSRRIVSGQYYILSRLTSASPETWVVVACLTQKSLKLPTKTIDITSDCGPDQLAGTASATIDIAGFVDYDSSDSESGQDFIELMQDSQNNESPAYSWKLEPETPVTGDQSFTFDANISNYQQNFNTDNPVDFTATLGVQGIINQDII